MRILAIDTSCGACSAAVFDGASRVTLSRRGAAMTHGQAVALGPMVEAVMGEVDGGFAALGRIVVAIGPGSFTGIRIGLAMARAIGLTLGVPVVGVSTLLAFAAPLLDEPQPGVIVSAVDARHGSVYFQAYEPTGRPLFSPRVASFRDAARAVGAIGLSAPARIAGEGAQAFAREAQRVGIACEAFGAAFPDIVAIARVGLAASPQDWPARPLYVKPPDAKPASAEAIARIEG